MTREHKRGPRDLWVTFRVRAYARDVLDGLVADLGVTRSAFVRDAVEGAIAAELLRRGIDDPARRLEPGA